MSYQSIYLLNASPFVKGILFGFGIDYFLCLLGNCFIQIKLMKRLDSIP